MRVLYGWVTSQLVINQLSDGQHTEDPRLESVSIKPARVFQMELTQPGRSTHAAARLAQSGNRQSNAQM
jgi:hypothetical protein